MPDEMGDWMSSRIVDGQFNNESEYVRDLIRKDQLEQERTAYLRARLQHGEQQIARGEVIALESDDDITRLFNEIDDEPVS